MPTIRVHLRVVAWSLAVLLLATACASPAAAVRDDSTEPGIAASQPGTPDSSTGTEVDARRTAILDIARAYATHAWRATEANALHGPDEDGIHVDTPDVSHLDDGFRTDGSLNTGVPYKWGGFSSLAEFDAAVAKGMPAGQLTDGVNLDASRYAVGVDCSGFVARCWSLPFKQSTRSLARLCFELASYDELLPGDLINKFDAHAMVFVAFEGAEQAQVRVIEAGFPNVQESVYPVTALEAAGFAPYRYKPLDERWVDVERAPRAVVLDPEAGEWIPDGDPDSFVVGEVAEGLDLRSMFDEVLPDGLGNARPGDWVSYGLGDVDGPLVVDVSRVVASNTSADGGDIEIQTSTAVADLSMGTLESHAALSPWVERMLALEDSGQPLDALAVVSGTVTSGRWADGRQELPAWLVALRLQGSMTTRGQALGLEVDFSVIVSPQVPMEGIVRWERVTHYDLPSGPAVSTRRYQLSGFGQVGDEGG